MNEKAHLKILESLYSLVKENPNDMKVLKHVSVIAWQLEMYLGYEDYTYHYVAELAMSKEAKLEDNKFYISSIEAKIKDLKKS